MIENKNTVLQKQERRYQFILELWKTVNGSPNNEANVRVIAGSIGFNFEETNEVYHYFTEEGFFGMNTSGLDVTLSHRAIIEIEKSIVTPTQATEHFSTTVIQNFNGSVGAVQTGNNNTSNVNQNIGQNFSEVLKQLAILKNQFQSLPDEDREEAIEIVDDLAVEVQSENPSKGKVKSFLSSVKDFAVKTGTDVTSKIVVELVKNQVGIS
ncbi:MAG: hypothetical protein LH614_02615 [Pyrinomonadaceae bacterium]|nr:hypothetical protein [Pyrinomonadaceae bacterium]